MTQPIAAVRAFDTLLRHNQRDLLAYMDGLSPEEQAFLSRQIDALDLSVLGMIDGTAPRGRIEPMRDTVTIAEIEQNRQRYMQGGLRAIRAGKVGAVLLAGGQGSRLGFEHPKGMYNIGVDRELYIFECLIQNLLRVTKTARAKVPLFIMTSADNDAETKSFFRKHKYFGYDPNYICFFPQEQLPTVDPEGRLMLSGRTRISTAPNGNGGWYSSMERNGILRDVRRFGIEWLNVFAVDNVLQSIADPCFIGAVIESGRVSGAKVVAKACPEEKVGVLCLEDGKPSIVEYFEMTDEMRTLRNADGSLAYQYGVILNYLFRVDELNKTLTVKLPLHRAFKKIRYMDESGEMIEPDVPNAYKFETLALDMVHLQKNCLAFEVDRQREFAPVKNRVGVDSVDTARALLRLNGIPI